MQQIALKKLQLSRIQEQQTYFGDLERRKKAEVESIDTLLSKYNTDNAELLRRALKRADILEKTVTAGFDEQK